MTEALLDRIEGILNEEKWTRAALSNYSVGQFKDLESILREAYENELAREVKELCDARLVDTKNSVVAMYLAGMITWEDQHLDDSDLGSLIALFSDNRKWHIVEYVCDSMLSSGESKLALRALVSAYENLGQEDRRLEALERLAKVDYEDADLAAKLAERYEADENIEEAVSYYKKAIYRYINAKQFAGVPEIWNKLILYCPDAEDLFVSIILKVERSFGPDRAVELRKTLYPFYKKQQRWDASIALLKRVLGANPKDAQARKELALCYREKYSKHSRLEEAIAASNLAQGWRNVHEAIESFEKQISLDKGRYVFHRSWGVGRIKSIGEDIVKVDFVKKRDHVMSQEMAAASLIGLDDDHIWVLKGLMPRDKLKETIKKDIPWALRTLAASFDGRTDMKKVKAELSPSILTPGEWTTWSAEARRVLKTHPSFGNDASKPDVFMLRSGAASYEEKMANRFKGEENFFKKLVIMEEFLSISDPSGEYFADMYAYFQSYLKSGQINEFTVTSFLFVEKISRKLGSGSGGSFLDIFNQISSVEELFSKIEDPEYKKDFLSHLKRNLKDWQRWYVALLPYYPSRFIVDELVKEELFADLKSVFGSFVDRYRTAPDAFFWLTRYLSEEEAFERYAVKEERVYIALLHLLDISFRNISAKKDPVVNKRINRQANTLLFKEGGLLRYIEKSPEETAVRIYSLVADIKELDNVTRVTTHKAILAKFPSIKIPGEERKIIEATTKGRTAGPVWVTEKSYLQKAAELTRLVEVEIPKNSAEIGEAIKKGDLKENAEYIFGKEKQDQLQLEVGRLQKELDNARMFDVNTVDTSYVSFGTTVTLKPATGKKKEVYTILGPWESDPDKRVLSYLAPFAEALLGKKPGETAEFTINEQHHKFVVEEIIRVAGL